MALTTVPRYDKNDPYGGTFVANLGEEIVEATHGNKLHGVGLNSNGNVVVGAGQTGILGVILPNAGKNMLTGALLDTWQAGDVIDVMVQGEVLNFKLANGTVPAAGVKIFSNPAGVLGTTAVDGSVLIGWTMPNQDGNDAVNGRRLFVNVMVPAVALDVA